MAFATAIVYPTEELLNQNHEYLILWMLQHNEICKWADFLQEPVEIKQATLSNNLQQLISNTYVVKIKRGHYSITDQGRDYFQKLELSLEGIEKEFPPKAVMIERNYADIILWMLFHNEYCTWSDFIGKPLEINQSSLSKYLNLLLNQEKIIKINKKYQITENGKKEYYSLIQKYHLDRQSILNEKIKQIDQETLKAGKFFDDLKIIEPKLKYYFCNLKVLLDYSKIASVLNDEMTFNKILLYLILNHPDQYPAYMSPTEFAANYGIDNRVLEYYLYEIIHNNLFATHFFEIETKEGHKYYFHEGEKIEKILSAIVEESITQETFFPNIRHFREHDEKLINRVIVSTMREIRRTIFDEDLIDEMHDFLIDYIKYQNMKLEELPLAPSSLENWDTVALIQLPKHEIMDANADEIRSKYFDEKHQKIVKEITRLMGVEEYEEAKPLILQLYADIDSLNTRSRSILAYWLIFIKHYAESLQIFEDLEEINQKDPKKYNNTLNNKAYCYLYMGDLESALDTCYRIVEAYPNNPNYNDSLGEILLSFEKYEEAIQKFMIAINSPEWIQYRDHTYVKIAMAQYAMGNYHEALSTINIAIASIAIPRRSYLYENYRKAKVLLGKIEIQLKNQV